jgi:hypothetical protein
MLTPVERRVLIGHDRIPSGGLVAVVLRFVQQGVASGRDRSAPAATTASSTLNHG